MNTHCFNTLRTPARTVLAAALGLGATASAWAHGDHGPGGHAGWELDHLAHTIAHWTVDGVVVLGVALALAFGWRTLRSFRRDRFHRDRLHAGGTDRNDNP